MAPYSSGCPLWHCFHSFLHWILSSSFSPPINAGVPKECLPSWSPLLVTLYVLSEWAHPFPCFVLLPRNWWLLDKTSFDQLFVRCFTCASQCVSNAMCSKLNSLSLASICFYPKFPFCQWSIALRISAANMTLIFESLLSFSSAKTNFCQLYFLSVFLIHVVFSILTVIFLV